jgi:hypothetical protein
MKSGLLAYLLIISIASGVAAANEKFLGWDTSNVSDFGVDDWKPTTTGGGIAPNSIVGLTHGKGLVTGPNTIHGWGGTGWTQRDEDHANLANDNFTFQFTVASGYSISLTSVDESYRRSSKSPDSGALQYSLDGGKNYTNCASFTFGSISTDGETLSASLSQTSGLQHLAAGTTVWFRQVNWFANITPNSSTVWYLYNTLDGDDFSFYGNVVGDIDQDNKVDSKDIAAMLGALTDISLFESTYGLTPTAAASVLDVNQDNTVNGSSGDGRKSGEMSEPSTSQ